MNSSIDVSVVIPAYNAEPYLARCLDSLVSQTLQSIEIIIVDDGSSDGTAAICDDYAASHSNVIAIHQANAGQTKARIAGLRAARGEYIHFVDADDWCDPDMEKIMFAAATCANADIVTCDSVFHKGDISFPARQKVPNGTFDKQGMIESVYPNMIYGGSFFYFGIYAAMWNKLFRRTFVTPHIVDLDPRVRIHEDGLTTFASFLAAERVVILDDLLYHYRDDNTTSLTRSYVKEQFTSTLLWHDSILAIRERYLSTFDILPQVDLYLLYHVRCIILEEFYYRHKKPLARRVAYIREIAQHPTVREVARRVDYSHGFSPADRRLFVLINQQSVYPLVIFAGRRGAIMRLRARIRAALRSKRATTLRARLHLSRATPTTPSKA